MCSLCKCSQRYCLIWLIPEALIRSSASNLRYIPPHYNYPSWPSWDIFEKCTQKLGVEAQRQSHWWCEMVCWWWSQHSRIHFWYLTALLGETCVFILQGLHFSKHKTEAEYGTLNHLTEILSRIQSPWHPFESSLAFKAWLQAKQIIKWEHVLGFWQLFYQCCHCLKFCLGAGE